MGELIRIDQNILQSPQVDELEVKMKSEAEVRLIKLRVDQQSNMVVGWMQISLRRSRRRGRLVGE